MRYEEEKETFVEKIVKYKKTRIKKKLQKQGKQKKSNIKYFIFQEQKRPENVKEK